MSGSRIYPENIFNEFFVMATKVFGKTIGSELISVTPMTEIDVLEIKRERLLLQIGEQMQEILKNHCQ